MDDEVRIKPDGQILMHDY